MMCEHQGSTSGIGELQECSMQGLSNVVLVLALLSLSSSAAASMLELRVNSLLPFTFGYLSFKE